MVSKHLTPVSLSTLALGKGVPHSVYTEKGELLLSQGNIVESKEQIESLLQRGYFKAIDVNLRKNQLTDDTTLLIKPAWHSDTAPTKGQSIASEPVRMEEIRWQVGTTVILQQQDSEIRHVVRFIGYIKNNSVFVTMPIVDGKYATVRDRQIFIVRAFVGKKAYAFRASVITSEHKPQPYLHLSYPKNLTCAVIRYGARIPISLPIMVTLEGSEEATTATISDISLGGVSATTEHPFGKVGQYGRIKFEINVVGEINLIDLRVLLRSTEVIENGGYKYGYQFVEASAHERLLLSAYFHQTEVERS